MKDRLLNAGLVYGLIFTMLVLPHMLNTAAIG